MLLCDDQARPWTFLLDVWQWLYRGLNGIHADLSCMGTEQRIATCVGSMLAKKNNGIAKRNFSFAAEKRSNQFQIDLWPGHLTHES